jgi:hypothetical protein
MTDEQGERILKLLAYISSDLHTLVDALVIEPREHNKAVREFNKQFIEYLKNHRPPSV